MLIKWWAVTVTIRVTPYGELVYSQFRVLNDIPTQMVLHTRIELVLRFS